MLPNHPRPIVYECMNVASIHFRPKLLAAVLVQCSLVVACQGLADAHTPPPPLASFRGTLSLASGMKAPQGNVKLAIRWDIENFPTSADTQDPSNPCAVDPSKVSDLPAGFEGHQDPLDIGYFQTELAFAEQQLELESEFPLRFTLNLSEPPPLEVLHTPWSGFKPSLYGSGQFVVYRDGNANGKLDASRFDKPSPDQLLAASAIGQYPAQRGATYTVEYVDRVPEFDGSAGGHSENLYDYLEPGYNLVQTDPSWDKPKRLPERASIELVLNERPILEQWLCTQFCAKPADFDCPADPADLPAVDARAEYNFTSDSDRGWYYVAGSQTILGNTHCQEQFESGARYFEYNESTCEGCTCENRRCAYWADKLPTGAQLPCASYMLGGGVPPDSAFPN
jgi:hypothetical protein